MIKYCLQKWDKNKDKLEAVIQTDHNINTVEEGYDYLVKLVVENILNDEESQENVDLWNSEKISRIDDGYYQGTLLYLIPVKTCVPGEGEYMMTYVNYGSCTGCDSLIYIRYGYEDTEHELPTEQQVKDYMTLCRDLVSHMIVPYNFGWRHDEKFDFVEEI